MKRTRGFAIVAAVLVAAAGGLAAFGGVFEKETTAKAELGVTKDRPADAQGIEKALVNVPAARVEAVEQPVTLRLTGSLIADEESDVGANVPGMIQEVFVERGSVVEKGDVLVQFDPTDAKNLLAEGEAAVNELRVRLGLEEGQKEFKPENQPEVKSIKANLDLAMLTGKRYADMVKQGIISKEQFDQARTQWEAAQQQYEQAIYQARQLYQGYLTAQTRLAALHKAVEDTTVRAPFSGWVVERHVSVGERINPGGKDGMIVTMVKIDPLRVKLTVPQQNSTAVAPGQQVKFRVDGLADREYTGEVRYVAPSVEAASRSLTAEAVVANTDRSLRPGMFVTAELALPEKTKKLMVPAAAVVKQGDVATLYVVQDGTARQRVASLGDASGDRVEVLTGLATGDLVVTEPGKVHDGDKIEATEVR